MTMQGMLIAISEKKEGRRKKKIARVLSEAQFLFMTVVEFVLYAT